MKRFIEVDQELYEFIASKTLRIGEESTANILRRLLGLPSEEIEPLSAPEVEQSEVRPIEARLTEAQHPVVAAPVRQEKVEAVRSAVAESGVFEELLDDQLVQEQKGAVGRFIYLLDSLYRQHPGSFEGVLEIRGRDRLYFSQSKEALLKASKTANPKQIGASGYWVSANNNTAKKRAILEEVLGMLGCQGELAGRIAERI